MSRDLSMFVVGRPIPQGSMQPFRAGTRILMRHVKGTDLAIWRAAISDTAYDLWHPEPPLDEPVVVGCQFQLPRPTSLPKRVVLPAKRPDLDKLVRAVLDALSGLVFTDDARVVSIVASKLYATGQDALGARISVRPVLDRDPGPEAPVDMGMGVPHQAGPGS